MIYLLFVLAVIGWTGLFYYRDKAKEFESLFELSKTYDTLTVADARGMIPGMTVRIEKPDYKLNKDGSIAKKRGRKAKA